MAASKIDIANIALRMIKAKRIGSFGDDTEAARVLTDIYEDKVEYLLREHLWNFAVKRASLQAASPSPEWGFANSFELPSDCVRVVETDDDIYAHSEKWQVEGRKIVTDLDAPLNIKYVARVDEVEFDPAFRECLAAELAAELALPLTGSLEIADEKRKRAEDKFRSAKADDGQEGTPPVFKRNTWVSAKWYGTRHGDNPGRWGSN